MPKILHRALLRRLLLGGLVTLSCLSLSWAEINRQLLQENMRDRFGRSGEALLNDWFHLIASAADQPELKQLVLTNEFFNQRIRYREDIDHWQLHDYWATPLELLGTGAGDCEDFTIAKYLTLIKLGISPERLRLIYVRAQIGGNASPISQAHMVLGYYESPTAMPLVLDSLVSGIQPANERSDLKPVFSFNSKGLWIGNNPTSQAEPTARLSRWRDLLERMRAEGFYE